MTTADERFFSRMARQREAIGDRLLLATFERKLVAQGVIVTPTIEKQLRRWISHNCRYSFTLWLPVQPAGKIELTLTAQELAELQTQADAEALAAAPAESAAMMLQAPKNLNREYSRRWPAYRRGEKRRVIGFEKRLAARYDRAFDRLEFAATLARDLGDQINEAARAKPGGGKRPYLVEAATRLHARACQITSEIHALLRTGHADGAMARWRSLHEVSVVLLLLMRRGGPMAEKYLLHEAYEAVRGAKGYNRACRRLGFVRISKQEVEGLEQRLAKLITLHGPFFKSDYGWACKPTGPKLNFADLEEQVGLAHFRPYYKMANHQVHAGSKGIMHRLSVRLNSNLLPVSSSNVGLTDPAQCTAFSLAQATAAIMRLAPTMERMHNAHLLIQLPKKIGRLFQKAERAIERDQRAIDRRQSAMST